MTPPPPAEVPAPSSLGSAYQQMQGPRGSAGVSLIVDNAKAWGARWELLTDARQTIELSTFILDDDVFGFAVLGALADRARAGVKVRLLLDGRGSLAVSSALLGRDYLQELVETQNVTVHVFNPPLNELAGALLRLNAVPMSAGSHNKILVVDNAIAIVGGRNVNADYYAALSEHAGAMADADVLLDGPLVSEVRDVMEREFSAQRRDDVAVDLVNITPRLDEMLMFAAAMDAWVRGPVTPQDDVALRATLEEAARAALDHEPSAFALQGLRRRVGELVTFKSVRGTVPSTWLLRTQVDAKVVATLSRARKLKNNSALDGLLAAIGGAKSDIMIQSPSFVLNTPLLLALQEASARGVAITLLTNGPGSSDSRVAQALFIDSWPELMARIPTLRIYTRRGTQMQHAKRAVFDDALSFVGTYNLDPFSINMNSETVIAMWSPAVATETRADLVYALDGADEYRIARDAAGQVQRHPAGHPEAGHVVVRFGPRDQVDAAEIAAIEAVKAVLLSLRHMWDFDVVVW